MDRRDPHGAKKNQKTTSCDVVFWFSFNYTFWLPDLDSNQGPAD